MRQMVNLRDATTGPVEALTTMGAPARMPNVVAAGGAFVGAASRWDGTPGYDTGRLYLFDPASVAVPTPAECCSGAYSALQVGRDDAVVATWFDLDASEQVVRLLKLDDLRMPAVGWPVDGFRLFDPRSFGFGGDLPRGVAAPDGGAVVVFGEGGAGGHRLQFVRVSPGS
jgi:hypothetical protein